MGQPWEKRFIKFVFFKESFLQIGECLFYLFINPFLVLVVINEGVVPKAKGKLRVSIPESKRRQKELLVPLLGCSATRRFTGRTTATTS